MRIGETFKDGRYTVLRKLGWGHFSTVWLVKDGATGGLGALKVVKSASHYAEAARDEITLLSQIKEQDPEDARCCARLLDSFEHLGPHGRHVCMLFEVLGDNLLALIRLYDHRGVPLPIVRALTRQILVALDFLHTGPGIIHTDMKPENVMLRDPIRPRRADADRAPAPAGGLARQVAAGVPLTKAPRKNLRRRQKKTEASAGAGSGSVTPERAEDSGDETDGQDEPAPFSLPELERRLLTMPAKVVDFGNACWLHKHFTDDIQTRQYRSPEVGSGLRGALGGGVYI